MSLFKINLINFKSLLSFCILICLKIFLNQLIYSQSNLIFKISKCQITEFSLQIFDVSQEIFFNFLYSDDSINFIENHSCLKILRISPKIQVYNLSHDWWCIWDHIISLFMSNIWRINSEHIIKYREWRKTQPFY